MGLMLLVAMCLVSASVPLYGWYQERVSALEYENQFVEARRLLDLLPGGHEIQISYRPADDASHAGWVQPSSDPAISKMIFIDPQWKRDTESLVLHEYAHVQQVQTAIAIAEVEGNTFDDAWILLKTRLDEIYDAPEGMGSEHQADCYVVYVSRGSASTGYIDPKMCPLDNREHLVAMVNNVLP